VTLQGGLELRVIGLIGTDDEGFALVHMTGYELEGIGVEEPKGATPLQALEAIRAEKEDEARTYSERELSRQRAEQEESGMVACGGFAMPCASRQPFRLFADFIGADPRFRGGPVKVSQDDEPIVLKPVKLGADFGAKPPEVTMTIVNDMQPAIETIAAVREHLERVVASRDGGGYPDGNPKTAAGMKKPDLSVVPPVALLHLATAMMNGANKYGPFNWRDQPISYRPYLAAAMRHLASCLDGEDFSADTVEAGLPVHHLGHVMACCAIVLDAIHCGTITDNRPSVPGQTGAAIELYNVEKKLLPTPQSA
jgi:hypothetical protein